VNHIQDTRHALNPPCFGTLTTTEPATTEPATGRSAAYRVLERIFDEGFATGNDAIVDEICSPDLVEHQFGPAGQGAEAIAHVKAGRRAAARSTSP
jgi:hypothetical protein